MQYALPPGFVDHDSGSVRVIAPRLELEEMVSLLKRQVRQREGGEVAGGRGGTRRLTLPGGKTVYVRKYLRGGAMRVLLRDLYLMRPPRPLRELVVTETARAAGCLVPTILAVAIEDVGPFYRGWVVTEAIGDCRSLIDELLDADSTRRRLLLERTAVAIHALHAVGVYHVDLTGHNLLVGRDGRVWAIDFDRGFFAEAGSPRLGARGIARLWRSLTKLARARKIPLGESEYLILREAYVAAAGARRREGESIVGREAIG